MEFGLGGFELAGRKPVLVRAFNVLRQYPVEAVRDAWAVMRAGLAPGGLIVDGTCDELGRRCCWVLLDGDGPISLTLACDPFAIERPSDLAERLPKVLIHHNVAGQPIHTLLTRRTARGPASRATVSSARGCAGGRCWTCLRDEGFPVEPPRRRMRDGVLSVPWSDVAPVGAPGSTVAPLVLSSMLIALAQIQSGTEPAANLGLVEDYTRRAADAGAGLVLFPEATMCRFGVPLAPIAEPLDGSWASAVREIAERAGIVVVAGMFVPADDGRVTNTLIATGPGVDTHYDKIHLYDAFGFTESDTVAPGHEPVVISVDGDRTGQCRSDAVLRRPLPRAVRRIGPARSATHHRARVVGHRPRQARAVDAAGPRPRHRYDGLRRRGRPGLPGRRNRRRRTDRRRRQPRRVGGR